MSASDTTVDTVQQRRLVMEASILQLIRDFERGTGCCVMGLQVDRTQTMENYHGNPSRVCATVLLP